MKRGKNDKRNAERRNEAGLMLMKVSSKSDKKLKVKNKKTRSGSWRGK